MSEQPTVEMAKGNSKQRIEPLIEESDVLRKLVRDPRSRDSGNTVLSKDFPGGVLVMTGANSAVGLRSMAGRYLFLDEVDAYPGDVEGEGDLLRPHQRDRVRNHNRASPGVDLEFLRPGVGGLEIETEHGGDDVRRFPP